MKKRICSLLLTFCLLTAVCPAAFAAETDRPIRVAVIDTGISPVAIPAENLAEGHNYVRPQDDTQDKLGHGTAVAGLIVGNQALGVEGVCPDAVLVPLVYASLDESGGDVKGRTDLAAQAIYDAVDSYGCRVINLSAGGTADAASLRWAVEYAERRGVLVVSSAGNANESQPGAVYYPGAYDSVLCVGAAGREGAPASFSQRNGTVDLLAPGDDLRILTIKGTRIRGSGTSYATAIVSGAAARLLAEDPTLTPAELRELLTATARDIGPEGYDIDSGWGLLDLDAALAELRGEGSLPFTDVPGEGALHDAVAWALERGVTGGTTPSTFSPDYPCTRDQAVTFLWKAAGCPEPAGTEEPFTDVVPTDYFYQSVLWAVGEGILTGTTDTTFSPELTCTRTQLVALLWRAQGRPQAAGESALAAELGEAWYADAVAWADCSGLLASPEEVRPDGPATRGDIVRYLYRSSRLR